MIEQQVSEWVYIGLAFGLTYVVLAGFWTYVSARVRRAERRLQSEVEA